MKAFRVLKKVLAAVLVVFIAVEGYYISQVLWYSVAPVKTSAYIESERERLGKVQFKPVRLRNISSEMVRAAVAAEDVRFQAKWSARQLPPKTFVLWNISALNGAQQAKPSSTM